MMDTAYNRMSKDLKRRTDRMFERFTKIHNKLAVKEMIEKRGTPRTFNEVCEVFNVNINWSSTKEGYVHYYTLNLRWILYLTYICYEEFPELVNFCIMKLRKFVYYSSSTVENEQQYCIKKNVFLKKIKKIEEIFGNKK